ncbi:sulfatase [Haloferula sp.]|uniref:sulfatase n=1 Tax=Haloferula sp. TaxID=2497595 RepID=UPI0032A0A46D
MFPGAANGAETSRPNILFIAIDDLRPELGCYGSKIALTPHIDRLAGGGLLFNRAYCQQPICGPSRASLMCGARPDAIKVTKNATYFRDMNPDLVTLSQNFIANGYDAIRIGKIFHKPDHADLGTSWNRPAEDPGLKKPVIYALLENRKIQAQNKKSLEAKYGPGISATGLVQGPAYESADVPDTAYRDGYNAASAVATLRQLSKNSDKPFFLGLGFYKPHLDFIAPEKYWKLYDREAIPLATETAPPKDGAAMGLHASFELRVRDGIPKSGTIDPELSRTLRHAYLACASYIDAQVGLVLNALDEGGLRDNTIVVLWGDHGWHLGEMGVWGKATNYEIATRVPLIVSVPPRFKAAKGATSDALVELVDLYPTLCELTGVPIPSHVEGTSFKPLLTNPERPWKAAAFTQFPTPALREWAAAPLSPGMRETFFGPLIEEVEERIIKQQGERWDRDLYENHLMAYSMRTEQHRLIVWVDQRNPEADPVFIELYDYSIKANDSVNIADQEPELVAKLVKQFRAGWKGAQPPTQ